MANSIRGQVLGQLAVQKTINQTGFTASNGYNYRYYNYLDGLCTDTSITKAAIGENVFDTQMVSSLSLGNRIFVYYKIITNASNQQDIKEVKWRLQNNGIAEIISERIVYSSGTTTLALYGQIICYDKKSIILSFRHAGTGSTLYYCAGATYSEDETRSISTFRVNTGSTDSTQNVNYDGIARGSGSYIYVIDAANYMKRITYSANQTPSVLKIVLPTNFPTGGYGSLIIQGNISSSTMKVLGNNGQNVVSYTLNLTNGSYTSNVFNVQAGNFIIKYDDSFNITNLYCYDGGSRIYKINSDWTGGELLMEDHWYYSTGLALNRNQAIYYVDDEKIIYSNYYVNGGISEYSGITKQINSETRYNIVSPDANPNVMKQVVQIFCPDTEDYNLPLRVNLGDSIIELQNGDLRNSPLTVDALNGALSTDSTTMRYMLHNMTAYGFVDSVEEEV